MEPSTPLLPCFAILSTLRYLPATRPRPPTPFLVDDGITYHVVLSIPSRDTPASPEGFNSFQVKTKQRPLLFIENFTFITYLCPIVVRFFSLPQSCIWCRCGFQ
ncbi:hypothetical protein K438DRAFT_730605 [Mycena galopus ATCC 62051]|nr:hypothetical protein K438DRAFT_730605 [Mycena galopus ATCC 62051]